MPKLAYRLYNDDCLDVMRGMKPDKVDTIICDPPYNLTSGKKGGSGEASLNVNSPAGRSRVTTGGGFMGKQWDATGVAFNPETWKEALRVAKPGAMLLAFGGTRTFHRLACAIEDAGWEIRDCVMWVYGSGFPKSHSIGKAIDRAAGAEREVVGKHPTPCANVIATPAHGGSYQESPNITAPATPAAQLWEGYGTALKPAWEPVIVAMKPLAGTFAANALEHGVAGLNIEQCRVGYTSEADKASALAGDAFKRKDTSQKKEWARPWMDNPERVAQLNAESKARAQSGRWPANLVWSHVPDTDCPACSGDYPACRLCGGTGVIQGCVRRGVKRVKGITGTRAGSQASGIVAQAPRGSGETTGYADADGLETVDDYDCHPDCPSRAFPSPHGAGHSKSNDCTTSRGSWFTAEQAQEAHNGMRFGDSGSAARFFYCAKSSRTERERGLIKHFPCLKCGSIDRQVHIFDSQEKRVISLEEWVKIPGAMSPAELAKHQKKKGKAKRYAIQKCIRNNHPTVKPLALMEYLCKLTMTPTGGIVLDPFMGSGSTGVACAMTGRQFIGIENDTEHGYFKVAQERIREAYRENPL